MIMYIPHQPHALINVIVRNIKPDTRLELMLTLRKSIFSKDTKQGINSIYAYCTAIHYGMEYGASSSKDGAHIDPFVTEILSNLQYDLIYFTNN